ncbi:hypothetical protein [Microbacterium sp. 18062]|uniref:hypothetical protein n=1 Tax=Microbacterium sp. 18062 TaxID=2681410 RepID=UPI00135AFC84|nr:hypothetical protein [Microbacterium sp. 18062]
MLRVRAAVGVFSGALLMVALAACAPDPSSGPSRTPPSGGTAPAASSTPTATPTPTATSVALPADCETLVSDSVLAQLADIPLNDPANGVAVGVQGDGSLVCLWRQPEADTTSLQTTVSRMSRGPALDLLNRLADDEGFTCYTPDGGTRCEKVWINEQYPVNDGRTLFWRDDVLIDTQYSNLAPSGYTDSVIAHVFG